MLDFGKSWREKAAQEPLCERIRQGKITAGEYITHDFPVEQIGQAVEVVGRGEAVKVVLRY